jgi:hypothetical protein
MEQLYQTSVKRGKWVGVRLVLAAGLVVGASLLITTVYTLTGADPTKILISSLSQLSVIVPFGMGFRFTPIIPTAPTDYTLVAFWWGVGMAVGIGSDIIF